MIVQVKKAFKSYSFFLTRKQYKSRQVRYEIFFNPYNKHLASPSIPYCKTNTVSILLPHLFEKISQRLGQDQINGKLLINTLVLHD